MIKSDEQQQIARRKRSVHDKVRGSVVRENFYASMRLKNLSAMNYQSNQT